ncbi:MAG TPA: polysaccharide biosynthesis protein [Candidatus Limnocylindrales bacterium]|nr:polysaccharide biosynthesis protein [Candidatus Limnocylindrales bacterium]
MKRTFDIAASAAGLVVLAPVFLVTAILIKLCGRGPVFFRQERVGRDFRPFIIYKFRTMIVRAEELGPGITAAQDRRVTRLGRILRKTKIDELPQLFNVIRGDMSFVGPRPELPRYVNLFRAEYMEILTVRPGITDPASITFRDEAPHLGEGDDPEEQYVRVVLPEKIRMAKDYVHNSSFLNDLRLIFATVTTLAYPGESLDRLFESLSPHRYPIATLVQCALLVLAQYLAFLARFDGRIPEKDFQLFLISIPAVLLIRLAWFYPFRLYRGLWRYVSIQDLQQITTSLVLSSATWWAVCRLVPLYTPYPRSVIILDGLISLTLLGGVRLLRRVHSELGSTTNHARRVLVVGSGDAGERILRGLIAAGRGEFRVVGLIDSNPDRRGVWIHNAPVLGGMADFDSVVRREDPDEILIAFSSTPEADRKLILRVCKKLRKPVKFIPDLPEILAGKDLASLVLDFEPDDLLFREPISCDIGSVLGFYASRRVLITGAGGSIGSEISRQIASCSPRLLVLFEKHEESLYMIDKELRGAYPDLQIESVIGDIADESRVREILQRTTPHAIFHAAAYKHVPMMERNAAEAFKTNVLGTRTVAELAGEFGAEIFVLISTDKAVEPLSVMGRTKRVAELLLHGMNGGRATKYLAVRFGNVLESSGSVIPLFREQIERGGPVTVTHPDVTRLFMTIPEAVQLILQAAPMSKGGETFVLDMGHPIRILDLAKALIRLYGLTPGQDIEIVFTGLRAGERLFEKLVNDHEKVWKTSHPKILMAVSEGSKGRAQEEILELVSALEAAPGGCAPAKLLELPKPHAARTAASTTREKLSGSPVGLN